MLKQLSGIIAIFVTFLFVAAIGIGYNLTRRSDLSAVPAVAPFCSVERSFPGFSVKLSEIYRNKTAYPESAFYPDKWSADFLSKMGEAPMPDIADGKEKYRFLWLRTFHHPVFVRVESDGISYDLVAKEFDGKGGYEAGKELRHIKKKITQTEWCNFIDLLGKAEFWMMDDPIQPPQRDGSTWILEGVREDRYLSVSRWSPKEEANFRNANIYLLNLAGIDLSSPDQSVY